MSQQGTPYRGPAARAPHDWAQALATVAGGLVALIATAALGVWAAGADELPGNAFPRVVAAVVVLAVGGTVDVSADAGILGDARTGLAVLPLSVTLAGALALSAGFLRRLRHRAVLSPRELAARAARIAVLWALALIALASFARQSFALTPDGALQDIGELLGASPRAGFRADVPLTVLFGLLWLAGLLLLTLAVSRRAPLPAALIRYQEPVRPVAHAMVVLLLVCVGAGVIAGLVVAATRGRPAETFAVILLGLPNLVWLALTLGMGATWDGAVRGPFGLPVPELLERVLRTPEGGVLNLGTLSERDGRVWWLLAGAALLLLGAAFLAAVRSPARTRLWQHAVRTAVALVVTVLTICLVVRVQAHYGLSLFGVGDLGGELSAEVSLSPRLWTALGLAALWGLVTGCLGALLARPVHRRGEVEERS
ncbi:streptophobe family protein [Streptomyces sp. NPDC020141]|uniref:streptophobe family protein n=1 Tax=Streptomyces sp. NPDC020141 TaxID=3365065 RepID=UPI0037B01F3D